MCTLYMYFIYVVCLYIAQHYCVGEVAEERAYCVKFTVYMSVNLKNGCF